MFDLACDTLDKHLCLVDFSKTTPTALNQQIKQTLSQADD